MTEAAQIELIKSLEIIALAFPLWVIMIILLCKAFKETFK